MVEIDKRKAKVICSIIAICSAAFLSGCEQDDQVSISEEPEVKIVRINEEVSDKKDEESAIEPKAEDTVEDKDEDKDEDVKRVDTKEASDSEKKAEQDKDTEPDEVAEPVAESESDGAAENVVIEKEDNMYGFLADDNIAVNQFMALADSEEEALAIADDYGIKLISFSYGVAEYHTDEDIHEVLKRGSGKYKLSINHVNKLY